MLIASYRQGICLCSNPHPLPSFFPFYCLCSAFLTVSGLCIIMARRTVAFRLLSFCSGGACVASRMTGSWEWEILMLLLLLLLFLLLPCWRVSTLGNFAMCVCKFAKRVLATCQVFCFVDHFRFKSLSSTTTNSRNPMQRQQGCCKYPVAAVGMNTV